MGEGGREGLKACQMQMQESLDEERESTHGVRARPLSRARAAEHREAARMALAILTRKKTCPALTFNLFRLQFKLGGFNNLCHHHQVLQFAFVLSCLVLATPCGPCIRALRPPGHHEL